MRKEPPKTWGDIFTSFSINSQGGCKKTFLLPGPSTLSNTCQVLSDEFTTKDPGTKRREEGWFFHLQWHLVLRNWNASWSTIFLPIITLTAYYKIRICITQKHMAFSTTGIASCQLSCNSKFKTSHKVNPLRR